MHPLKQFRCALSAFFLTIGFLGLQVECLVAEIPSSSQQLIKKLNDFEADEKRKLEALLDQKREAVIEILKQHATDESRKGNVDGAIAIREKILELGGTNEEKIVMAPKRPAASWEVPDDAFLYRGDYYKVYPSQEQISWKEARARCHAVGGEIGWLDRDEDIEELRRWMQPVVDAKGHAPIWMGATSNDAGEWTWINGDPVAENFWNKISDSISQQPAAMIRWIGSFKAAPPDTTRTIGYLGRWKR
ncbi:MAG: lectin-like protein [Verrucomicrobiales bacterium]|nr:lectin-like protein [Verrucomicrobiales bacterium]